jgi:methionine-S-sulfoxide reductase
MVEYDASVISYEELLGYFWRLHNPTTLNRQGPDFGTQYRSAIFYHNDQQRITAEKSKQKFDDSGVFDKDVVTQIVQATEFYPAEEYHQKYLKKTGRDTCHFLREK